MAWDCFHSDLSIQHIDNSPLFAGFAAMDKYDILMTFCHGLLDNGWCGDFYTATTASTNMYYRLYRIAVLLHFLQV